MTPVREGSFFGNLSNTSEELTDKSFLVSTPRCRRSFLEIESLFREQTLICRHRTSYYTMRYHSIPFTAYQADQPILPSAARPWYILSASRAFATGSLQSFELKKSLCQ